MLKISNPPDDRVDLLLHVFGQLAYFVVAVVVLGVYRGAIGEGVYIVVILAITYIVLYSINFCTVLNERILSNNVCFLF